MDGFKEIPNTNGVYLINESGVVYSRKTNKILEGSSTGRYMYAKINGKCRLLHRLVMITFCPIENWETMVVNHKDKNTCNNHVSNLEWCTQSQNMKWNSLVSRLSFHPYEKKRKVVYDLIDEKWRVVKKFKNYSVSNMGRIKVKVRFGESIMSAKPRREDGYIRIQLGSKATSKGYYLHRLIAEAFIPNPENKRFVNHIDGNKSNNLLSNLEWATVRENVIHARDVLGVQVIGSKCHNSVVDEHVAREIKILRKQGLKIKEIANKFNLKMPTVGKITTGVNWKHIIID